MTQKDYIPPPPTHTHKRKEITELHYQRLDKIQEDRKARLKPKEFKIQTRNTNRKPDYNGSKNKTINTEDFQ